MRNFFVAICLSFTAAATASELRLTISDSQTGRAVAARVYLRDQSGQSHYFRAASDLGTAFRYDKQNGLNKNSIERHTTVSAHPCVISVDPGTYQLVVHRGKEYFPHSQIVTVTEEDLEIEVSLRRWISLSERGWYSGDTHIHRTIDELRNVIAAEDLNVVFPLTNWVTIADTPPSAGDKNLQIDLPDDLVRVDDTHVIWPRSTEYEIFSVAKKRHTLGALFVLGHRESLQQTVPPWKGVVEAARTADPNVLFDMDKLAWPFAMVLPTIAPNATYELANNHMWRTEFAFENWYTPAPSFIQPPFGGTKGSEREWIDFTLGMYYVLLDCGFRMPPSAGTANGVHPVPAGFGRVYVHQPDGFDYEGWRRGLQQGRSFVTTGPMLFATVDGKQPGHVFRSEGPSELPVQIEVVSETPLSFGEVIVNGKPEILLRPQNKRTDQGAFRSEISVPANVVRSGWLAVRFWEDRPNQRVRFAHTAPWYVEIGGKKEVLPRAEEKQYLIDRMQAEIQRSRPIVSPAGLAEYESALAFYRSLPTVDESKAIAKVSRPINGDDDPWLRNMIVDHRFSPQEVQRATGVSLAKARELVSQFADKPKVDGLRILPYPGGRHPRRGFLDGAVDPQRDTKVSVFPPWSDGGYAVVDVPEAIFSNLGLTYLAHEHIPTIWSELNTQLQPVEWQADGNALTMQRELPNGIAFGSRIEKQADKIAMKMWLRNGTDQTLTGLRSQVCVMLSGLVGFNSQRKRDQVVKDSVVAVKADRDDRWIITAWEPHNRAWTNPPVPCIHSDPVFDDCNPGETVTARGHLWFYEGDDIQAEIQERLRQFNKSTVPTARIVKSHKIWDQAKHNAFTDLIRFKDQWFCVFREGTAHVSPDGSLRVLKSDDGQHWESAALIQHPNVDLRDAKITTTPDGQLMLSGAAAVPQPADYKHQSMTWLSDDGISWSDAHNVGERDFWLWRTTWHRNKAFGIGYATGKTPRMTRLYSSDDGKNFTTLVETLQRDSYPNETSMLFNDDDSALCLLRRDGGTKTALLGSSLPPYTTWDWKDLKVQIGGPHMIRIPSGELIAVVRLYDGGTRTSVCHINPETATLTELTKLPSGGDTSYAGLVWHDDHLWVSYYSQHEATKAGAKTAIYFAQVKIQ